nr:hypothetical protein [Bacteroidales bacterium]
FDALLEPELKKEDFMDEDNLPKHDTKYLMNASYESLMYNIDRTLDVFIIFEDNDTVIEVQKGKGYRSKALDKLMNYFIEVEDYEKCAQIRDLKIKIIEYGD